MSKKSKQKQAEHGTYALCITIGLIIGFGLGAIADNIILLTPVGAIVGAAIAYGFNHMKRPNRN